MPKRTNTGLKRWLPGQCEICPETRVLTKHRIVPGRDGGEYTPENVLVCCLNCHHLIERGRLVGPEVQRGIVRRRLESMGYPFEQA